MFKVEQIKYAKLDIKCSNLNIIIGPNNSGKTIFLNHVYQTISKRIMAFGDNNLTAIKLISDGEPKLIDELIPKLTVEKEFFNLDKISTKLYIEDSQDNFGWNDKIRLLLLRARKEKFELDIDYEVGIKKSDEQELWRFFTDQLMIYESCGQRLNGKFSSRIDNALATENGDPVLYLYQNRDVFNLIQKHIHEVFDIRIDFDNVPQGLKSLRIIKSKIDRTIKDPVKLAKEWERNSIPIEYEGDGIRSYIKLIISILIPSNHLIFIDEPEAFLHPPQRRALGSFINKISKTLNKQFFITSHDGDFLRSIISHSENDVNLIRFSYTKGTRYINLFDNNFFKNIIKSSYSNLMTERILNSFSFHKTILCEDESDRLFYEEACAHYFWDEFQDINFVGLNGKDQAIKLFEKLQTIGLNVAVIVDIDFIIDNPIPKCNIDPKLKKEYGFIKDKLKSHIKNGVNRNEFKKNVANALKNNKMLLKDLRMLLERLKENNIYVVPVGTLESWTIYPKGQLSDSIKAIHEREYRKLKSFLKNVVEIPKS